MNEKGSGRSDVSHGPSFFSSPVVQASVPALYAWAITVAQAAFGKGGTTLGQFFALLAVTFVAVAVALEFARTTATRFALPLLIWGMTLASGASFLVATPRALSAFDTTHSVAGVVGWLLFALASAAPALRRTPESALAVKSLANQKGGARSAFGFLLATTLVFCVILQSYGWNQEIAERSVLLRVASIVLSLVLLAIASKLLSALGREPTATVAPTVFRTTLRIVVALLACALAGFYLWLRMGDQ